MVVTIGKFETVFESWAASKKYQRHITDTHINELWEKLIPLFADGVVITHQKKEESGDNE